MHNEIIVTKVDIMTISDLALKCSGKLLKRLLQINFGSDNTMGREIYKYHDC